ncbi:MAG: putative aminotransferase [Rhizobacter sp.]|nr:putative aminotransferase [Rhizobacter sp.]
MLDPLIDFIRATYRTSEVIPLHAPVFRGNEKLYVADTIESTFVSSVGAYVDRFEHTLSAYTGSERAVAVVNGTAALHIALKLVGVTTGDFVITQPLTFIASCAAITYCGAEPVFVDVDKSTLGLSPSSVGLWLEEYCEIRHDGICHHKVSGRVVRACVPMHTFGHPADLDGLTDVCRRWNLALVEDAAESLGSRYRGKHTGTFGRAGALSFNGNKIITTGGGGAVLTDAALGARAKHITTTAKQPHPYEFVHDEVAYNYRMPNLNAALGCAQMEMLAGFIEAKRRLATDYADVLKNSDLQFVVEPADATSNYWLNAVICANGAQRDQLLDYTNSRNVMTRPIWRLMSRLPMFEKCPRGSLENAEWLEERVVNLPSSVPSETMLS